MVEPIGHRLRDLAADLVDGDRPAGLARQRRHARIGDAAGDDGVEGGQVGVDVECEAVQGDPSCDTDSRSARLFAPAVEPDAGSAVDAPGGDAVGGALGDQGFLGRRT